MGMTQSVPRHRLFLPLSVIAAGLVAAVASGCLSDRYVGSVGKTGTYSSRGYGLSVRLTADDLSARYKAVDPRSPHTAPDGLAVDILSEPLDINADGVLHMDEAVEFNRPTLRLFAKTSSIGPVWIDVDVSILSGKDATHTIDAWMAHELKQLTGKPGLVDEWTARRIGPDYEGRVAEVTADRAYRLALIDHKAFEAEEGTVRRQLVRVLMVAPKMTPRLRRDHDSVLDAIGLNQQAAPLSASETW